MRSTTLARFAAEHPRAGLVGPLVLWPDGTWQPSLRRFPTVLGTIWRRTPLRSLRDPYRHQVSHYGTRPDEPVQGDWLLGGACLLMRRAMLDELGGWDGGFRHYVEDIDLAYRAAQAGWERWLVPEAVVRHDYAAVIDKRFLSRHTLWHVARDAAPPAEAPRTVAGVALEGHELERDDRAEGAPIAEIRVELGGHECGVDGDLDAPWHRGHW